MFFKQPSYVIFRVKSEVDDGVVVTVQQRNTTHAGLWKYCKRVTYEEPTGADSCQTILGDDGKG